MVLSPGTDCFHSLPIIDILKKCTVGNVFTWTAQMVNMYTFLYHDGMNAPKVGVTFLNSLTLMWL